MAGRAIWKGVLVLGGERIPLKLYSAVEDRSVRFRLLHEPDRVPVEQRLIHPVTEKEVAWGDALRGHETEDGRMVVLDEADLDALEPEASRDIEVLRFVEPARLPHGWYDRPYYLGPDGEDTAWAELAAALAATELEGVVRWVMRKRTYFGALRLHDGVPMLVTLRDAREVVDIASLDPPSGRALDDAEIDMARKLVAMLEGPFEPNEWEDDYRARVMELIEARAEGKTISLGEYRERARPAASLIDALSASLAEAEERKGA